MPNQNKILDSNIEIGDDRNSEKQPITSISQFALLCFLSFGLYSIWWVYKAWRFFKEKEKSDIQPALRAIFSIIFLPSLFNKILDFAKQNGYDKSYSSSLLFIGFILLNILSRLPDPFWLVSIFAFVFLIPPLAAFNFARQNSSIHGAVLQTSFNGRQIVLIVLGTIFWGLVLLGLNAERLGLNGE